MHLISILPEISRRGSVEAHETSKKNKFKYNDYSKYQRKLQTRSRLFSLRPEFASHLCKLNLQQSQSETWKACDELKYQVMASLRHPTPRNFSNDPLNPLEFVNQYKESWESAFLHASFSRPFMLSIKGESDTFAEGLFFLRAQLSKSCYFARKLDFNAAIDTRAAKAFGEKSISLSISN